MSLSNVLTIPSGGNSAPTYYGFFNTFVRDFAYSVQYSNAGATEDFIVPVVSTAARTDSSSAGIAYTQEQGSATNHSIIVQNAGLYAVNQAFKKQMPTNYTQYNSSFFLYKWQLMVNGVLKAEAPIYELDNNTEISCILNLTAGSAITNNFVISVNGFETTTFYASVPLLISTNIHSLF